MTWEIGMTLKMKYVVIVVDGKNEFEHVPQTTSANATATACSSHVNSSAFHRSYGKSF